MSIDELPPTPEELHEAELLAKALEGEGAPDAIDDALAAAGLLRAAKRGDLSELRERAVFAKVRAAAPRPKGRGRVVMGAILAIAAAAALAVVTRPALRQMRRARLPKPSMALIKAQLAMARPKPAPKLGSKPAAGQEVAALGALEQQLHSHRVSLYVALEDAYGVPR